MLGLLLLACSNPVWKVIKQRTDAGCTLLLVDATASMYRKIGDQTAWQLARTQAIDWMSQHPDDPVLLGILTDQLRLVLDEPSLNHSYLANQLQSQDPSYAHGDWLDISSLAHWDEVRRVHLFTDAQANTFPSTSEYWKDILESRTCRIHDVAGALTHNIALYDVTARDVSTEGQHVVSLDYSVQNNSSQLARIPVTIFFDGQNVERQNVTVLPGQNTSASIRLALASPDAFPAKIQLNVDDDLGWDNLMYCLLPEQIQPKVRTLEQSPMLSQMQQLFRSHDYHVGSRTSHQDTLLITSPVDTSQTQDVHDHLSNKGTVMWLLHDDASVAAFRHYAQSHISDTLPQKWESRQTLVPDYWQWDWQQSGWLTPFKKGYESALMKMTSSKVLLWEPTSEDAFAKQWAVLATQGGEPVVMWRWQDDSMLLVIVMPTIDLQQRLNEPAILGLLLRLGDYATKFGYQLSRPHPGNPDSVGCQWEPKVNTPANLIWEFDDQQSIDRWDGLSTKLDKPGLYTLRKLYGPNMSQSLATQAVRVHPKESGFEKINLADFEQWDTALQQATDVKPLLLWPWLLVTVLILAGVESIFVHRLVRQEVVFV